MTDDTKFWGKYRGTVANNIDPELRGRLQVIVPDVLWRGFVVKVLWNWFIPTTFSTAPQLNFIQWQ